MANVIIKKNDQMMISLVHYFVTKEDYAPIRVQGVSDEVWLENLNGPYRIIRITANPVINEEQFKFDLFKMKHIMKQIKRKTLSFKVNALNICLDMSKKFELNKSENIDTIRIDSLNEIRKNEDLKNIFPSISNELLDATDGLDLLINVTNDINRKTEKENKKFAEVFSPKKIIYTKIIMLLCFIMYIVSCIFCKSWLNFSANDLAKLGANNIMFIKNFELWRLIVASFLHVGLIHLIVNMYSLAIIGTQVETFIGKTKFVIIYLISAITGNLMSLVFGFDNIVSVGASGAIFGLMGALLYFGYHYRLYLNDAIRHQIIPIIVVNLLIGFCFSGIDNAAHIGGLVGGFLTSMALGIKGKSEKRDILNGWIVLVLYVIFLSVCIFVLKK